MHELLASLRQASTALGLRFEPGFIVRLPSGATIESVARFPDLGDRMGMIIVTDYEVIRELTGELTSSGYGYSVLSESSDDSDQDLSSYIEMFSDWGWTGAPGARPAWFLDSDALALREVKGVLQFEVAALTSFQNSHGISPANIEQYLVDPYLVAVDPDDGLGSPPRPMWVVLQERGSKDDGYLVVFDHLNDAWGIAEHVAGDQYILVVIADTLASALESM